MDEGTNQMIAAESDEPRATSTSADDYDENTEQLRADIEDTRAEMSQTINEIQVRLSPEHLVGQVKETVREATIGKVERVMERVGETISEVTEPALEVAGRAGTAIKEASSSVADSVWRNPIPVALIGLGVGMLVMRNFRGRSYSSTSRRLYPQGQAGQTQGSGAIDYVKDTMDGASTVTTRFEQVLRNNPLAIGAVAVAAGTAVGLVLPSTRFESEYMGETGEKLVDTVEDVARGALDKVQDAAKQMAPQA